MMDFKVDGVEEIDKLLGSLPKKLQRRAILNAVRPGARHVLKEVKLRAPKRTGAHVKTIKLKTVPISKSAKHSAEVKIVGGWKSNWLEYGTSMQPAQPHFRPPADALEGSAQKIMADKILDAIGKVVT